MRRNQGQRHSVGARSPVHTLKVSISGVRGVVGESLTPQLVVGFSQAFGCYVDSGVVLVGRDTRRTGEMVRAAVTGGLLATGCYVIDLGIVPVPTILIAVKQLQADGAIAITASHNPAEWNALKFARADGVFLNSYQATELIDVYHQGQFRLARTPEIAPVKYDNSALERHIELVVSKVDVGAIRARRFRVAVDACNGAGGIADRRLLEELGCQVTMIHDEPSGDFPHDPEPTARNLRDLCRVVQEVGADIGFAQDADADRLALVSEKGRAIGEEYTLAFACDAVCAKTPGPIAVNISTSRMVDEVAAWYGVKVLRTRVGEVNVVEAVRREGAVIGGEGNGGVIYPAVHWCRDSLTGMALVLEGLARRRSVSEWAGSFRPSAMHKTKIECSSARVEQAMAAVQRAYADCMIDRTEGIRVVWPETGVWLHIRPSNTEPVIRVVAEADNRTAARRLCTEALQVLQPAVR